MRDDANQLGGVLGFGVPDTTTYGISIWKDSKDNLYSCASLEVTDEWITTGTSILQRPEWDQDNYLDMEAAERAQSAIVLWNPGMETAPLADPEKLTVIVGVSGIEAIELMGLSHIEIS